MEPGTRVEVRSRFDRSWARGFEVVEVVSPDNNDDDGVANDGSAGIDVPHVRVRRRSDGQVLPALFTLDDVREEKKGRSMWWY